jgi:hypothetical protein
LRFESRRGGPHYLRGKEKGSQADAWLPGWCSVFRVAARGFIAVTILGTKPSVATVDDEVHAAMLRRAEASDDRRALRSVTGESAASAGYDPAASLRIPVHVHPDP